MTNDVCFSGGAIGSDTEWGKYALAKNHKLIHYVFHGHRSKCPHLFFLEDDELTAIDVFVSKANESMGRRFPSKSNFVNNLLRRNFYQILNTERVYAVSTFNKSFINGGTAWACQMYLDLCKEENKVPELYVYDQDSEVWKEYDGNFKTIIRPPSPHGKWTGIGTKVISNVATLEIHSI